MVEMTSKMDIIGRCFLAVLLAVSVRTEARVKDADV
jgi:hypothetical protein